MAKFRKNVERDRRNQSKLRKAGWHVYVVWECQLNSNQKARKSAVTCVGFFEPFILGGRLGWVKGDAAA